MGGPWPRAGVVLARRALRYCGGYGLRWFPESGRSSWTQPALEAELRLGTEEMNGGKGESRWKPVIVCMTSLLVTALRPDSNPVVVVIAATAFGVATISGVRPINY
jgi:hypothetical protein